MMELSWVYEMVRRILSLFIICHGVALGFWNDNHIKQAWTQHRTEIETETSAYASAQKGYKMAYWAANQAYKRAQYYYQPGELASVRSYLQLSYSVFNSGSGFGGIKKKPIDPTTRELARKTLTILGLMVRDPLFSFDKESTAPTKVHRQRAKEFLKKVQQINRNNQLYSDYYSTMYSGGDVDWSFVPEGVKEVDEEFKQTVNSYTDDKGKTIINGLSSKSSISLFPATLEEEISLADAHVGICPGCKEMQTTPGEMEAWWKARIKEDPTGRNANSAATFGDSFDSFETSAWGNSGLKYLKAGQPERFSLASGIDFNVYVPKNVQPGAPVVFIIYDGIRRDFDLYNSRSGFNEETVLAHAGCIVVRVKGMKVYDRKEPSNPTALRYNRTNFPDQIFKDIEDIYIALRDQTFVRNDGSFYPQLIAPGKTKTFLHGASFGGYMTMMAATTDYVMEKAITGKPFRELFDGYIPYAGFYDWAQDHANLENSYSNIDRRRSASTRDYKTRTRGGEAFDISQHTLYLSDDPLANEAVNHRMSPLYHVDRLNRPVLLMHGFRDTNVGVDAALNMLGAIKKAHKQYLVDLMILPEHKHDSDASSVNNDFGGRSRNEERRVEFLKDYFDPMLYFIRQIQNDERPQTEHNLLRKLKEKAQRIKSTSQEDKLLGKQKNDRYQDEPLSKLSTFLSQRLTDRDARLTELLQNPTEAKIIDYAKEFPIYTNQKAFELGDVKRPDLPSAVYNETARKRLMMLFLEAIYALSQSNARLFAQISPDSLSLRSTNGGLFWLEERVSEDLNKKAVALGRDERATALANIREKGFSDENIIAYLEKLPNFFGISGPYKMTPFFYQLKRKEIRQAIRNVLFPSEWLYDRLKEDMKKESARPVDRRPMFSSYDDHETFLDQCRKIGHVDDTSDMLSSETSQAFESFKEHTRQWPDSVVKRHFLSLKPLEFTKLIQPSCARINKEKEEKQRAEAASRSPF